MKRLGFLLIISISLLSSELTTSFVKNTTSKTIVLKIIYNQVCIDTQTGNVTIVTHGPTSEFTLIANQEKELTFEPLSSRISDNCSKDITCILLFNGKKILSQKLHHGRYEIREHKSKLSLIKTY